MSLSFEGFKTSICVFLKYVPGKIKRSGKIPEFVSGLGIRQRCGFTVAGLSRAFAERFLI